ncbi:hypothetical protein domain protein [Microcystis aeruginosa TAIHU98]|uniref:Uncharacterized protein n=1 Tax=Microcystis aeruginosa TAIHU98 TaxID=1134457 RepID=L7E0N4_MICAE|nr:hypothetical protein domain protein [Microcystis aeruginosa TAIHU98]
MRLSLLFVLISSLQTKTLNRLRRQWPPILGINRPFFSAVLAESLFFAS